MTAVVLHSGGMDSTTLLYDVLLQGRHKEIVALNLEYGASHNLSERIAASSVLTLARARFHNVIFHIRTENLPKIFSGAGSALMGDIDVPNAEYVEEGPQPTVVPFRNANLLSAATTIALTYKASEVYAAMHASDHEGWAYPDCSPEFLGAMANAIYVGTMQEVRLRTPYNWMTKGQIAQRGAEIFAPLGITWSCYRGGDLQCGNCPTCRERAMAFWWAGYRDPTRYEPSTISPEVESYSTGHDLEWPHSE